MNHKRDVEIRTRILLDLKAEPRIGSVEIAVEVRKGAVTLKAQSELAKKLAAAEAAHRVAGVLVVVNGIEGGARSQMLLSTRKTGKSSLPVCFQHAAIQFKVFAPGWGVVFDA